MGNPGLKYHMFNYQATALLGGLRENIDENFTTWRYKHAILAQRMIGQKLGTGGSSGADYLKRAAEGNRIFSDLTNLSSYLLPSSLRPELPETLKKRLGFRYSLQ